MTTILNEFISGVLQLIAFTIIPYIFFLFRKDKNVSFFKYIGLTKPTAKSMVYAIGVSLFFVVVGIGLIFIDEGWKQAVLLPNSVTGKIRLMGFNATSVSVLLINALIKTSLWEELFFRGFLAKRLINKFGFKTGNILQAVIFGAVHLALFGLLSSITFLPLMIIFGFSTLAGWSIGFIKEKYANGSIFPGWLAHGLGNTVSYSIIAFII
jgi:membrane protease YdiL (CAAX protease family)